MTYGTTRRKTEKLPRWVVLAFTFGLATGLASVIFDEIETSGKKKTRRRARAERETQEMLQEIRKDSKKKIAEVFHG